MYKTLRKVLLLFVVSIAVVFGSVFAVACGDNDGDKGGDKEPEVLAAPTGLSIDDNDVLSWNPVDNASGYVVYDGDTVLSGDIAATTHSYDLNDASLSEGDHLISVAAKGDGVNYSTSPKSSTVTHTVGTPFVGSGSKDDPYYLVAGNNTISVPANGSVYYSVNVKSASLKYTLNSDAENITLEVYSYSDDSEPLYRFFTGKLEQKEVVLAGGGFAGSASYYFVFSTVDGSADEYGVFVTIENVNSDGEPGSESNPIIITSLGTYSNETKEVTVTAPGGNTHTEQAPVHYQYTVATTGKLYFAVADNTTIQVNDGLHYYSSNDEDDKIAEGWSFNAGDVLTIIVSYDDGTSKIAGPVSFSISDKPSGAPAAPVKLNAPSNVELSANGVLSWDGVENAIGYIIYDGDDILVSNVAAGTCTYDISGFSFDPGTHYISVVAKGDGDNYLTSAKSSTVKYVPSVDLSVENGAYVILDGSTVTVNLADDVVAGTQYALTLESAADNSDEDFLDYFTGTVYTVSYDGSNYVYDADKFELVYREIDWNSNLITFVDGVKSFTISAVLPDGASLVEVNLSLVEITELTPRVAELKLDEARQDAFSGSSQSAWEYTFSAPNYEYYVVEITCADATSANDINVHDGREPLAGELSGGKLLYKFFAEDEKDFSIIITSLKDGLTDYTVKVVQAPCGDFYLDKALSVEVAGSGTYVKCAEKTFTSPVNAKYRIEMTGATTNQVYIRTESGSALGNDELIGWGANSYAEFTLGAEDQAILGFYLAATGPFDVEVTITQLELVKEYLAPGGDPVTLKVADSKDTAGEVALDSAEFTNGNEYTIFVAMTTQLMSSRATALTLYYNGAEITLNLTTVDDEYDDGYVGTFTYNSSANSLWVYNSRISSVMKTKVSIIVKVEGLAVGGSITLDPEDVGDGYGANAYQQGGKEIPLLIPSSGRYTITITPGAIPDYSKQYFYHDGVVKQQVNGSYTGYFEAGSTIRILVNGGGSSLSAPITVSLANP